MATMTISTLQPCLAHVSQRRPAPAGAHHERSHQTSSLPELGTTVSVSTTFVTKKFNESIQIRRSMSSKLEAGGRVQDRGRKDRRQRCRRSDGIRMMAAEAANDTTRQAEPLRVMIAGAPASGKGTQCELIVQKFGLSHISTGDLLREEVAAKSEFGKIAKTYMDAGELVPNEIVLAMVDKKLAGNQRGWLLDGYPRSEEQAESLEVMQVRPHVLILLDVPEDVLIERVAGRRLDPVTGKIYHMKFSPPESEVVSKRLIQRSDDNEEKAKVRLSTYRANLEAITGIYKDVITRVDGNRSKHDVFGEIAALLEKVQNSPRPSSSGDPGAPETEPSVVNGANGAPRAVDTKYPAPAAATAASRAGKWVGVPTKLNTTPHSREIRNYFYADVCNAVKNAVEDGIHKLKVHVIFPELNPEMDVFRIGTLLEAIRELAFTFAIDGKRVRVCVQGSMGQGIFLGMPLQLAGVRQLLNKMDWGEYGDDGTFIRIGSVGSKEVLPDDDMFVIIAPQNTVGNCIITDLEAMVKAAGDRPVIVVNPRLQDVPGAGGVMQVQGRDKRRAFANSFFTCYHFRLLYQAGTLYPILGALRRAYPSPYQIYKRFDTETKSKEIYVPLPDTFEKEPVGSEISDAYYGLKKEAPQGFLGFLSRILG